MDICDHPHPFLASDLKKTRDLTEGCSLTDNQVDLLLNIATNLKCKKQAFGASRVIYVCKKNPIMAEIEIRKNPLTPNRERRSERRTVWLLALRSSSAGCAPGRLHGRDQMSPD